MPDRPDDPFAADRQTWGPDEFEILGDEAKPEPDDD